MKYILMIALLSIPALTLAIGPGTGETPQGKLGTNPTGTSPIGVEPTGTGKLGTDPTGTGKLGTDPIRTGRIEEYSSQETLQMEMMWQEQWLDETCRLGIQSKALCMLR